MIPDETIELTYPRNIDGDPRRVVELSARQWDELTPILADVAEQTGVQLRNWWLTRQHQAALEDGVELNTDELNDRWERSREARTVRTLHLIGGAARAGAVHLNELTSGHPAGVDGS